MTILRREVSCGCGCWKCVPFFQRRDFTKYAQLFRKLPRELLLDYAEYVARDAGKKVHKLGSWRVSSFMILRGGPRSEHRFVFGR